MEGMSFPAYAPYLHIYGECKKVMGLQNICTRKATKHKIIIRDLIYMLSEEHFTLFGFCLLVQRFCKSPVLSGEAMTTAADPSRLFHVTDTPPN